MGTSHEEPMMRSTPVEWDLFGLGPWDYGVNAENIYNFWVVGTERAKPFENIFTVGMRGVSWKASHFSIRLSSTILQAPETVRDYISPFKGRFLILVSPSSASGGSEHRVARTSGFRSTHNPNRCVQWH